MKNVQKVSVNFKAKTATVVTKAGSLNEKTATKSLKKAGYGVTSIKKVQKKAKKKGKKSY